MMMMPIQSVSLAAIIHTEASVSSAAQLGHCCSSFLTVAASRLWNSLPLNCRTALSVNTLKIRLKTFLFDLA